MVAVDDLAHLAVHRDFPPALRGDFGGVGCKLSALLRGQILGERLRMEHVRNERADDRAVPELHPLLGEILLAEALAELDDAARCGKILLDNIGIDRFVLGGGRTESSQVDGLAGPLGTHDDPPREIVGADPEAPDQGVVFEGDEVLHHLLDIRA